MNPAFALAAAALLVGCSNTPAPETRSETAAPHDPAAEAACRQWDSVKDDIDRGDTSSAREDLQSVRDQAARAETDAVLDEFDRLLAAAENHDQAAITRSIERVDTVCLAF